MSATPIPRTLHMSLSDCAICAIIETPPEDRMAIHTVVANWDEKLIQSAIEQELTRWPSLFRPQPHRHHWEIAAKLQGMAPQARIAVGHGNG